MPDVWVARGTAPERRQCKAIGWPNRDSAGEVMYDNTHFASEEDAWAQLERGRTASHSLALAAVNEGELALTRLYERLARETKGLEAFLANRSARHLGEPSTKE